MLDIGIIGLGPAWESRYRTVLLKLRDRIRVRSLYDAVSNRSQLAAAEFEAHVSHGIHSLIQRRDVRAILLLDPVWYGHVPLHFACTQSKPVFIVGGMGVCLESLQRLHSKVAEKGIDLMPEFRQRYTPATARLRELIATRLGPPRQINIQAVYSHSGEKEAVRGHSSETDFLVGIVDWCRYLMGVHPRSINSTLKAAASEPSAGLEQRNLVLEYRKSPSSEPTFAYVNLARDRAEHHPLQAATPVRYEVLCEHGKAILEGNSLIDWENGEAGERESLTAERTEVEVMLDHFCRRVVGALIPIPNIDDVCRALLVVQAADVSESSGGPVEVV